MRKGDVYQVKNISWRSNKLTAPQTSKQGQEKFNSLQTIKMTTGPDLRVTPVVTFVWPIQPHQHRFLPPPPPFSYNLLQEQNQNNKIKIYSSSINATILYLKTGRIIKTILLLQNYLHKSQNITMLFMKTRHTLLKQTPSLLLSLPPWLTSRSNQIPNPRIAL